MPASSQAQQRFFGLVRAVQKGDMALSDVSPGVQHAAKRMKPVDAWDFAHTKRKGLPEKKDDGSKKKASALDLVGASFLFFKQSDASGIAASLKKVQKSIQQVGAQRRKQLEKDLATIRAAHQSEQESHHETKQELKRHEAGIEDKKLEMELKAQEMKHQQQLKHEQQRMQLELSKSTQQAEMERQKMTQQAQLQTELQQQQMAALNQPAGPEAPVGQVPFGAMLQQDPEEQKKKSK